MVGGRFAVIRETSGVSYVSQYLNDNYTSLDSQRGMLLKCYLYNRNEADMGIQKL